MFLIGRVFEHLNHEIFQDKIYIGPLILILLIVSKLDLHVVDIHIQIHRRVKIVFTGLKIHEHDVFLIIKADVVKETGHKEEEVILKHRQYHFFHVNVYFIPTMDLL